MIGNTECERKTLPSQKAILLPDLLLKADELRGYPSHNSRLWNRLQSNRTATAKLKRAPAPRRGFL